ncbi:MAG: hypothetical protein AB8G17_01805 [Gammaproteobacteria bacterium]
MAYLIQQIIWFVLLTAVLWGAIGWWLRSTGQRKIVAAMAEETELKIQSLRRSRDEYRDQVEELSATSGALTTNQKAQVTDYVRKLEDKISTGKTQIAALSEKMDELTAAAKQREAQLASLHGALEEAKRSTTAPPAQTPTDRPAASENNTAEQVREQKRTINKLNARIQSLSQRQQEPMAATEHASLLDVIRAQKETIAGMARKFESHSGSVPKAHDEKLAALERTIAARDKELNRTREQIAQMHERSRSQQQELARLEAASDQERDEEDRESLLQALREQERIIVTLKEQLRERVTPPTRPPAPTRNQQSGDLFTQPPKVLLSEPAGEPDDLQKIHGVGPVLEAKLNELGIFHFRQVAKLSDDDIGWIAAQMNAFPNRILRERWVSQAAVLADDAPES